jgi:biopolymer transport protein ExbD
MAFGSFSDKSHPGPMAEINVTPMVDVMLVLLVIFILTAPLYTHSLKLELPNAQSAVAQPVARAVTISIDAGGALFWNKDAIGRAELDQRMAQLAPQTEIELRADKKTAFEVIADVMSTAQSHGQSKLGFVTAPKPK